MRRYLPALLLALALPALGPFGFALTGCDMLKAKADADAAADATAPVVVNTTTAAPDTAAAPPIVAPTIAPTIPTVAPTGTVTARPVGADAAVPPAADAGVVKTDAGVVPVPTLNIPHLFDAGNPFKGFDAGGLKIPTFPK